MVVIALGMVPARARLHGAFLFATIISPLRSFFLFASVWPAVPLPKFCRPASEPDAVLCIALLPAPSMPRLPRTPGTCQASDGWPHLQPKSQQSFEPGLEIQGQPPGRTEELEGVEKNRLCLS